MRFIGSKAQLLKQIEQVINENTSPSDRVFCDIFSGTAAVAQYFKPRYEMHTNDLLHFSYVIQKAIIENNTVPKFEKLSAIGIWDPFKFLEESPIRAPGGDDELHFITNHYSPHNGCQRMYLSVKNAARIDYIRNTLDAWQSAGLLTDMEYYYLLAGLIEGVPYVSNITGTYGAYLKQWDKRAYKDLELVRLDVVDNGMQNHCYNQDANKLIETISGDILYLDPPYNSRQYAPNYHLLETISRNDRPQVSGVTGMRDYSQEKSAYCTKSEVAEAFEDLIAKAQFSNIILSYSSEGLMDEETIEKILKKHGVEASFKRYDIPYRKYKSKIVKEGDDLNEYLFFAKKKIARPKVVDMAVSGKKARPTAIKKKYLKSPLNYVGGKYKLLGQLLPLFPANIGTFVDLFAGGANVAINVSADKIICNDINSKIIELFRVLQQTPVEEVLGKIRSRIAEFGLSKTNEQGFLDFRAYYNRTRDPIDLYTLACYSFNYQFRFNNNHDYNNPFGKDRSQFSETMERNLIAFMEKLKQSDITFTNLDFTLFDLDRLGPQDMIYCDPPYLFTTGTYNDGNRGFKDWGGEQERQLFAFLDEADKRGIRFALSNVLVHKGRTNEVLLKWSKKYHVHDIQSSYANASYNTAREGSREVLITNY